MASFHDNVCPVCWRGTMSGGSCSVCHHKVETGSGRRADALPLGTVLMGRYQIGEVLGNGGFGITYSTWDRKYRNRVALKELYPRREVYRASDRLTVIPVSGQETLLEELKQRFEQEASLLLQLRSEDNLVKVYDLFRCNGTVYYTMEYLEGTDLHGYLKRNGPMEWTTLEPMMKDLLRTLSRLHSKNLIHRDISPDNLFLTTDNRLHLIDFGSVRTYQGNRKFTVHLKDNFAPWEQYVSDGKQGPWTDIYSLSVSMYMLLSGKLPPKAGERINGTPLTPLRTLAPSVPERVALAIEKGLEPRIADRTPNAEQFMKALGMEPAVLQTGEPRKTLTTGGRRYWLLCQKGVYVGQVRALEVGQELCVGRLPECQIAFPEKTPGVSRRQCVLYIKPNGMMLVRDAGSTYGTYLDGKRLTTDWTAAQPGSLLQFGNEAFRLVSR